MILNGAADDKERRRKALEINRAPRGERRTPLGRVSVARAQRLAQEVAQEDAEYG